MSIQYANAIRSDRMSEIVTAAGSAAILYFYDGAVPTGGGAPAGDILAELTCDTVLGTVTTGVLTFNTIIRDEDAAKGGDATFLRLTTSAFAFVADFTGAEITAFPTIVLAQPVEISTFTVTEGNVIA